MIVLGLTGSIGMGKSTAAAMLRRLGVPLFDADDAVHQLLGPGGGASRRSRRVSRRARRAGAIDRAGLGQRVFGDAAALRRLEAILHPMVRGPRTALRRRSPGAARPLVVLDIPLLFETGGERRCDYVVVVSAPARVQRERVLRRPGMTESRFARILRAQMPDREKRRRADFVVPTGLGRGADLAPVAADRQPCCETRNACAGGSRRSSTDLTGETACARSCSTPRPPASTRRRAPHRRGRLHRADAPRPDRAELPPLCQSRARHAGGCVRGARPHRRVPRRAAALRRDRRRAARLHRRRPLVIHNAEFDLGFLNAELARLRRGPSGLRVRRHAGDGAPALSGRAGQPRRAVPPLRDRPVACATKHGAISIAGSWPRSISSCSAAASRPRFRGDWQRRCADAGGAVAAGAARRIRSPRRRSWPRTRRCCSH